MGKKRLDYEDLELRKIALQLGMVPGLSAESSIERAKLMYKFLTSGKKIEDYRYAKDEANEKTAERIYDDEPVEESNGTVEESGSTVETEVVPLSIYALALEANATAQRALMPGMLTTTVSAAWRDAVFKLTRTVLDSKDNVIDTEGLALNAVEATLTEVISLANKHGLSRSDTVTVGQVIDAVNTLRARG